MIEGRRTILLDDDDWGQLQRLAARVVRDAEMPQSANRKAGRVSALCRLLARGELLVVREGEEDQPVNN